MRVIMTSKNWTKEQKEELANALLGPRFGEFIFLNKLQHLPLFNHIELNSKKRLTKLQKIVTRGLMDGCELFKTYREKWWPDRWFLMIIKENWNCPVVVPTITINSLIKKKLLSPDPKNKKWLGNAWKLK